MIREFKREISKEYEMKDLGAIKHALGIKIDYDHENGLMTLSQEEYVKGILQRFEMLDSTPHLTPMRNKSEKNCEGSW